jgi:hypothetical protein
MEHGVIKNINVFDIYPELAQHMHDIYPELAYAWSD